MRFPLPLLSLALLAGCEPQPFRAETELRPDGTVARTVQQPDLAGTDGEWDGTRQTARTSADDWDEPLADLPEKEHGGARLAWGEFVSAAALPAHVRDGGGRPTTLERDPVITDRLILTEYRWRETVLPGTDLLKAEVARGQLIAELVDHLDALFAAELPGVNAAPLSDWVRTAGDALTADLLRLAFGSPRAAPAGAPAAEREAFDRRRARALADLLRTYGVDLFAADGSLPDDPAWADRLRTFGETLLRGRLLAADGGPVDEATLDRARWLLFPRTNEETGEPDPEWTAAHERAILARYGSREAFRAKTKPLMEDLFAGLFALGFDRREFVYRHKMPGLVLETNGVVLSGGEGGGTSEVLFRFELTEAFPDGRDMTARSVRVDADAQTELLGAVRVATRAEVVRFLELASHPTVAAVWERCVAERSVEPLRPWRFGPLGELRRLLLGPPPGERPATDAGADAPAAAG